MDDDHASMAEYTAVIEQLCAQRSALVQTMVANPEQIRDLAALQCAFLAVEAEKRSAERETLQREVEQRTSSSTI